MLRENTLDFPRRGASARPITGFSCWALGYLDRRYRLVGCLLHPARNGGVDGRDRVGFGEKCRRESCPQSKTFLTLGKSERRLWLRLAQGLDAFAYSSRACNPLFEMLGWGAGVLGRIAEEEPGETFDRETFFRRFSVFSRGLHPQGNAYLMDAVVGAGGTGPLGEAAFGEAFEGFVRGLRDRLVCLSNPAPKGPYTHRLGLDPAFSDFLRLFAGLRRTSPEHAGEVKGLVDRALDAFGRRLSVRRVRPPEAGPPPG